MDRKNELLMSVLGVFALVIVTVGASYAFFSYTRTGLTTNTITSGDISFTFKDERSVSIENAFPVADAVAIADSTNAYTFSVSGAVSEGADVTFKYNVTLVSDNTKTVKPTATAEELEEGNVVKGYFTNDQIKVNLLRGTTDYLFGTANTGVLLSTVAGFGEGLTSGSGVIAKDVEVNAGETDNYTLKMWIDEGVDYSNTISTSDGTDEENDAQTSVGKYNGYTYTLKVKVDSTAVNNYTGTPQQ